MSFTVTPDTIVKILVRRGLESERVETVLTEGELGYTVDTRRLFTGDGVTLGGTVVGNKFLGFTGFAGDFTAFSQSGDLIVENNVLKVLDSNSGWTSLAPSYYTESQNLNIPSIEYSTQNRVRVSPFVLGDGLSLTYSDVNPAFVQNTIQRKFGSINFDANYLSLSAQYGSFYFGNIFNRTVSNNLSAKVNVESTLFVNSTESTPVPRQIKIFASDPININSTIENSSGQFDIKAEEHLNLFANNNKNISLFDNNTIRLSAKNTGIYNAPDIDVFGNTQFRNKLFVSGDTTMFGNLSVFGEVSYLETVVTTTSALSVVNINSNTDTAVFIQRGTTSNQNILRVEGNSPTPFLIVRDGTFGGGVIGINNRPTSTSTGLYVASDSIFYNGDFKVIPDTGTIRLSTSSLVDIHGDTVFVQGNVTDINPDFDINLRPGSLMVYITGGLLATGDISAFSDISLKKNISKLESPIEKINKINGVEFEWNENAHNSGKSYGVIAQEVEEVFPHAVKTQEDGLKTVDYNKLIPALIEAVKELSKNKSCCCKN